MSKNRKKNPEFSGVAARGAEMLGRRTSSNIVGADSTIVMSCVSPTGMFRTPPPPIFKAPRQTPYTRFSSESPRGTPSDGGTRAPIETTSLQRKHNVGQANSEGEHTDFDTTRPLPRGDYQGGRRNETPSRRTLSPSSATSGQGQEGQVPERRTSNDGRTIGRPGSLHRDVNERAKNKEVSKSNLQQQTFTFYNSDEEETDSSDDSSDNYAEEIEDIADEGDADATDLVPKHGPGETNAEKRRRRRYAKKAREREGDRRRFEGKPRNYLLVDQLGRPYGLGVGDWRKEVILMSKKLDPAIGQINKQPMDAVKEISEWIQVTWEYSSPMQFEVVKEVVARGVTLRRAELWKKISKNEPKPEDVTDRAWRSLKKELQNPASIRKSVLCSKANACRVNFGRTVPSGEVGIRERLRRQLRRQQIASSAFVVKLIERLAALENSLRSKSVEVTDLRANHSGRQPEVTAGEDGFTDVQIHEAKTTEAADLLKERTEVHSLQDENASEGQANDKQVEIDHTGEENRQASMNTGALQKRLKRK